MKTSVKKRTGKELAEWLDSTLGGAWVGEPGRLITDESIEVIPYHVREHKVFKEILRRLRVN